MAVAIIAEIPGGSAEFDGEIQRRLNIAANPPRGVMARFAGPTEGGWKIFSVWESEEDWEAFRRDRLEPVLREMGIRPRHEVWRLTSTLIPALVRSG